MTEKLPQVRVPPKGSRGDRFMGGLMMRLARPVFQRQVSRYRKAAGPEAGMFMGFPVLLLTTIGSRSGKERTHVLGGFPDGDEAWLIVASKGGSASHPAWFHNLAKNPGQVWAQVGNRRFKADVESLSGADREQAYDRVVKVAPVYAGYRRKTDREIPVLRLTPGGETAPGYRRPVSPSTPR